MTTKNKTCPSCKKEKLLTEFYSRRKNKEPSSYCKDCTNSQAVIRQRKTKQQCIEYKGGKCSICGYSKSSAALDFHHINPAEKDFQIAKFRSRSFSKIKEELDKCILICSNCHREAHENMILEKEKLLDQYQSVFKPKQNNFCITCNKQISLNATQCKSCAASSQPTKIQWPSDVELAKLVCEMPRTELAKKLQVSDVAIAKRCRILGIKQPERGYWAKLYAGLETE